MAEVPPASRYTGKGESSRAEERRDPLQFSDPNLAKLALVEGSEQASELESMKRLAAEHVEKLRAEIRALKPTTQEIRNLQDIESDYDSFARGKVNVNMIREMRDQLAQVYTQQGRELSEALVALGIAHERSVPASEPATVSERASEERSEEARPHTPKKLKTARPGQKGIRTDANTSPLKSLKDLGPALNAAQKGQAIEAQPKQEGEPKVNEPTIEAKTPEPASQPEPRVGEVATPLPVDATKAETKEQLKTSVSRLQEFAEKAGFGAERTAMLEAEKAYLAKHREFYAKNDVLERLLKRSVGRTGFRGGSNDIAELKELKQKYDEARISYDNAIRGKTFDTLLPGNEKMDARLVDKYVRLKREGKLERTPTGREIDIEEFKKQALEKRAERSTYHIRAKEVLNRARLQVDAKAEGLNEKGLELWDRVPNLLAKGNAALEKKFGKNGARVVKALGATSFVLGGMAVGALGGAVVLSAGALLGVGSATFGRKLLASTLIGPAARAAARVVYDRTRGKQLVKEAKGELSRMDKDKGQLTAERLAAYDTKRIKLSEKASGEYQKRERGLIEFAVTFVAGGGAATALFNEEAVDRALDSMPPEVRYEVEAEARQIGAAIEQAAAQTDQPAVDAVERTAGGASVASEVSQLAERAWHAEPLTVTLDRLEGADHLFTDMRAQLLEQYPDEATRPPAVEHILEANHPNVLSREFGFADGMNSLVMYEGDSFSITEEGDLVFAREGNDPVVLLESNGERPEGFVPVNDRPEFREMPSPQSASATPAPEVVAESEVGSVDLQSGDTEVTAPEASSSALSSENTGEAVPANPLEVQSEQQAEAVVADSVVEVPTTTVSEDVRSPASPLASVGVTPEVSQPETQTIHEAIRSMSEAPTTIPEGPAVFDGYPQESFTNSYNQAIDPSRAGVYQNADGAAFVFGGDYAQMRQAAEAFAREHPGTLVTFEDRPHLTESGQVERSAARLLSDERGRIIVATYQENRALIDQLPNPYTFVSRAQ